MCAGQLASDTDVQFSFKIFKKKKKKELYSCCAFNLDVFHRPKWCWGFAILNSRFELYLAKGGQKIVTERC